VAGWVWISIDIDLDPWHRWSFPTPRRMPCNRIWFRHPDHPHTLLAHRLDGLEFSVCAPPEFARGEYPALTRHLGKGSTLTLAMAQ
jgi:hypothetical protein